MVAPPRRRPFPYDFVVDGQGFMGGLPDDRPGTQLVATRPPDQASVSPTDYGYSADNPIFGKWQPWENLGRGLGYKTQERWQDGGYSHCINADLSLGVPWLKGPNITSITPSTTDSTNGVSHFFEVNGALYALVGRYCLVRAGDDANQWTVSKDFGSGKAALDVAAFFSNVSGGAETAYVAMGDSEPMWRFTGGTWTQCVEIQTVAIGGVPTGGHFHLTWGGNTTGEIAYNASAATAQTALRLLAGLGSVTVSASGTLDPGPVTYTVTFFGASGNPAQMTSTNDLTGGTPTITHATTQDYELLYARAFGLVGNELYRAHTTNTVTRCTTDADPFLAASYIAANAYYIGDKNSGIVRMVTTVTGTLLFLKTDGIYTLNSELKGVPLYPSLRAVPSANNGKANAIWLNNLYVTYREGTYAIGPDFKMEHIGPERLTANDSEVHGYITAMQGHDTFNLYAGLYNPDNEDSYLLKYGAWLSEDQGEARRVDAWHGSISSAFSSKKITALFRSTVGAASNHSRLYIGFSDGTVAWFGLPCVPNPAACSSYTFSTTDGEVHLPNWHGLFKNDAKALRSFMVTGDNLSATNYAQVSYKLDSDTSFTALANDAGTTYNFDAGSGREENEFPDDTQATTVRFKILLVSSATSSCPQITGVALRSRLLDEQLREMYEWRILTVDGLLKRDGTRMRLGADKLRTLLRTAAVKGTITVIMPDESSKEMTIVDYGETTAWDERIKQWRGAVLLKGIEYVSVITKGQYGTLEGYSYTQLEGMTYAQMEAA